MSEPRSLHRVETFDEAELRLLSLANEKGKFAILVGLPLGQAMQDAFERGIDNEWFALVDVGMVAAAGPGRLMRVFRLTQAGQERRAELRAAHGGGR